MAELRHNDPISLLQELQQASLLQRDPLQTRAKSGSDDVWVGIGFRLDDTYLLSPIDQVQEVLPRSRVTPVPGTKDWLVGLVNLRGTFVSVVDMARFLGFEENGDKPGERFLLIADNRLNCAISVLEVFGLKQFEGEAVQQEEGVEVGPLTPYLTGQCIKDKGHTWRVMDLYRLSKDRRFVNAVG